MRHDPYKDTPGLLDQDTSVSPTLVVDILTEDSGFNLRIHTWLMTKETGLRSYVGDAGELLAQDHEGEGFWMEVKNDYV